MLQPKSAHFLKKNSKRKDQINLLGHQLKNTEIRMYGSALKLGYNKLNFS